MFLALRRLFFIALAVTLSLVLSLFFLRVLGQQQEFAPLNHKLFSSFPPEKKLVFASIEKLKNSTSLPNSTIPVIDAFITNDGHWVYIPNSHFPAQNMAKEVTRWKKDELVAKAVIKSPPQLLKDIIEEFSKEPFIAIYIKAQHDAPLKKISEWLKEKKFDERVIVFTDFAGVKRELKKVEPRWIYSSTPADLTKMKLLNSFFIETTINFDFDLLVVPSSGTAKLNPRLLKAIQKSFKRVILDLPLQESFSSELNQTANGVIFK